MPLSNKQQRFEREMKLLAFVAQHTNVYEGSAMLSRREMANELAASDYMVGHSLERMRRFGLLVWDPCFAKDGGRLSNAYRLTDLGIKMLETWQDKKLDIPFRSEVTPV